MSAWRIVSLLDHHGIKSWSQTTRQGYVVATLESASRQLISHRISSDTESATTIHYSTSIRREHTDMVLFNRWSARHALLWYDLAAFILARTHIDAQTYVGGQYMGTLVFPSDYPFKPPAIRMITPSGKLCQLLLYNTCHAHYLSGRFQCNTRLCFSMSDFHPKSWNPSWQVSTILTGLLSFMTSNDITTGAISTSQAERKAYARDSVVWNNQNRKFGEQFPDTMKSNLVLIRRQLEEEEERLRKVEEDGRASNLRLNGTTDSTTQQIKSQPVPSTDRTKISNSSVSWGKWGALALVLAVIVASRVWRDG